jgi:signal transduction histidine kinase
LTSPHNNPLNPGAPTGPRRNVGRVLSAITAILLAAMAALAAFGLWSEDAAHTHGEGLHITKAGWQVIDAPRFSAAPPTKDSAQLPAAWQPVELPHALPVSLLRQAASAVEPGGTRISWFRLSTQGPAAAHGQLALYGARVRTDGTVAVYADGQLVHAAQQQGPLWNSSRTPLWVPLDKTDDGRPPREILIRLEHTRASQVALSSLWLGPADALSWRHSWRHWLQLELPAMFSAAFLAVGIFALFVWLRRRHRTAYLLFFVLAGTSFLRGLHFYIGFPIANDWFAWLTVNSLFWLVATVHVSLVVLHRRKQPWLTGVFITVTVLMGLLTLPVIATLPNTPRVTPLIYVMAALMGSAVALAGGINAWRARSGEAMLVAAGTALCTAFGAGDWLLQNNFISPEGWYLGAWTNAITFSIFGTLLYRRYVGAMVEVERVNAGLAERLSAREAELELSHQRLRAVERRQMLSEERQRMMQDMHDGLGSTLISAIRSVEHGGMSDSKVSQILKDCMDDLKLAIDSMEPVEADLLLLLATLRFRLEPRLEDTGVTLLWEVRELPTLPWLDPSSALHILRIVQESVANVLRHTQATEIRVGTAVEGDGVQVTIGDNGQGFDVESALANAHGKGLHNQLRRAQMLGGRVAWQSGPAGTRFTLWLPLARPPHIP